MKDKINKVVDKVGPNVFPDYERLRIIAKDPESHRRKKEEREEQKTRMKKSASFADLTPMSNTVGKDLNYKKTNVLATSMREGENDRAKESIYSSRRGSFDFPKSLDDYDLDYLEELEMNKAFNIFKDI